MTPQHAEQEDFYSQEIPKVSIETHHPLVSIPYSIVLLLFVFRYGEIDEEEVIRRTNAYELQLKGQTIAK